MIALKIIQYPHRTLRHRSKVLKRVDREIKNIVAEMFELMYEARGIGLAANQVDLPFQLFIINTEGDKADGEELVFINPVIESPKGVSDAEEGCLSLPGVHGIVARPEQILVKAYGLSGNEINITVDALLARAIQHEFDHLQGTLFIDRISESAKRQIDGELEAFELDFEGKRAAGLIGSDVEIDRRLASFESKYC